MTNNEWLNGLDMEQKASFLTMYGIRRDFYKKYQEEEINVSETHFKSLQNAEELPEIPKFLEPYQDVMKWLKSEHKE